MAFTAGQKLRASQLNSLGNVVGRHTRTSDELSTSGATAVPIMSVRAPVVAGRSYMVSSWCDVFAAVAASVIQLHNRYTTDDTEPTVATGNFVTARIDMICPVAAQLYPTYARGIFDASSDGFLRVLMTMDRSAGSGNISVGAGAINPATLIIEDIGLTVAESGTDY